VLFEELKNKECYLRNKKRERKKEREKEKKRE